MSTVETRDRLLDAAETLFARSGLDATSLRAITSAADANLAAVNYHFGTKEGLIAAVFQRRIEPLNEERLQGLERAIADAVPAPPSVDEVVRALLGPALRLQSTEVGRPFLRLLGRVFSEPGDIRLQVMGQFHPTAARFLEVLQSCLPDVPRAELVWRLHFLIGSMAHVITSGEMICQMCGERPEDSEQLLDRLVAFGTAGFCAPVPIRPEGVEKERG